MPSSFWNSVWEKIKDGLASIPKSLIQVGFLALVIFLLGQLGFGNWLRCAFLDTRGCLAKVTISVITSEINPGDLPKIEKEYEINEIRKPVEDYVYVKYEVTLNNIGYANIDIAKLSVIPIPYGNSTGFLVGYKMTTGPSRRPPKLVPYNTLHLQSFHFEFVSGLRATERARADLVIAYPKEFYDGTSPVLLEVRCDSCQVPFVKALLK